MFYAAGIRVAALFNPKARHWLAGRKKIFQEVASWRQELATSEKVVWMHCASLGEFEQGRPVLEAIRIHYPNYKLLITFFSPSGYMVRKSYPGADGVFYLPADSRRSAERFIETINPTLVIWVKYEYWYYYLTGFCRKGIPVLLISALFREGQPFFTFYGGIWKKMLQQFRQIFVQNEIAFEMLEKVGLSGNAQVAGDTRFDRVIDIAAAAEKLPDLLATFGAGKTVVVAGSTWEEDEEMLVHYARMHPQIRFIIAPHEIDTGRLADIRKLFGNAVCYSEFIKQPGDSQVIIIDNIGMLSSLYRLADITYVGGGFNDSGIHNILEAGVYGKPIIFGPVYEKFREATDLVNLGGAFSISTALELEAILNSLLGSDQLPVSAGAITRAYILNNKGATAAVMKYIYENRLLTS